MPTFGLRKRIKDLIKREIFGEPPTDGPGDPNAPPGPADPNVPAHRAPEDQPATTTALKMYRIRRAADLGVQLWLKYDNNWRHVDPWALKYGRAKGSADPMLYARCEMHPNGDDGKPKVEAFRIDRIQDVYLTDRPHVPVAGWSVEIA